MGLHSYDWIDFNKITFFYRVTCWGTDFLLCTKIGAITGYRIDYSNQGWALAEPGGPRCQTIALGLLENLTFFIQVICWAPLISQVQSSGLPLFSLEHSLDNVLEFLIGQLHIIGPIPPLRLVVWQFMIWSTKKGSVLTGLNQTL